MVHFCTYFDQYYLSRGLALYRSLRKFCPSFQLWILCMDGTCYASLVRLNLPNVRLLTLDNLEDSDKELLCAKQNRTRIEYYFTCTPSLPLYVLQHAPEVDLITYLDADLCFFANPAALYEEIGPASIAIIEHRFPPSLQERERYGIYNVGWLSFRRDEQALQCLHWWRERCLEWCYDRCEEGRYADQKYLDKWPGLFRGVVVLRHKGANLAPWNLGNYDLCLKDGRLQVDEQALIFYHFHGLKHLKPWLYDSGLALYGIKPSRVLLRSVYLPYLRMLLDANRDIASLLQEGGHPADMHDQRSSMLSSSEYRPARGLRESLRISRGVLTGNHLIIIGKGTVAEKR